MDWFLLFSAIVPGVILLWLVIASDKFPEPPGPLAFTFLLGCLMVGVMAAGAPLFRLIEAWLPAGNPLIYGLGHAFLLASIPEEALKLTVLCGYSMGHPSFDERMDGIVYGVTAALGFATIENIVFVMLGGYDVAASRALLAVPHHAMDGAIMGYFAGKVAINPVRKGRNMVLALLVPVMFHGMYDTALLVPKFAEQAGVDLSPFDLWGFKLMLVLVVFLQISFVARITGRVRREQEARWAAMKTSVSSPSISQSLRTLPQRVTAYLNEKRRKGSSGLDMLLAAICIISGISCLSGGVRYDDLTLVRWGLAGVFILFAIIYWARGLGMFLGRRLSGKES